MTTSANTPEDGDFASLLDQASGAPTSVPPALVSAAVGLPAQPQAQSMQEVLEGQEPTQDLLEEVQALRDAPELPEEELARQALEAGGGDGDPKTPE